MTKTRPTSPLFNGKHDSKQRPKKDPQHYIRDITQVTLYNKWAKKSYRVIRSSAHPTTLYIDTQQFSTFLYIIIIIITTTISDYYYFYWLGGSKKRGYILLIY